MFKYIGDLNKLRDYGFVLEKDCTSRGDNNDILVDTWIKERYLPNNNKKWDYYEVYIAIDDKMVEGLMHSRKRGYTFKTKKSVWHSAKPMNNTETKIYIRDLIRDGLVINE